MNMLHRRGCWGRPAASAAPYRALLKIFLRVVAVGWMPGDSLDRIRARRGGEFLAADRRGIGDDEVVLGVVGLDLPLGLVDIDAGDLGDQRETFETCATMISVPAAARSALGSAPGENFLSIWKRSPNISAGRLGSRIPELRKLERSRWEDRDRMEWPSSWCLSYRCRGPARPYRRLAHPRPLG